MSDFTQDLDLSWLPRDPAASERRFRSLLAEVSDPAIRAETLTLLARAEAAQGRHDEARVSLDGAGKILGELLTAAPVRARIRVLLEDGRLLILLRTPALARARFAAAWSLAVNSGEDFFVVDVARMMAEIEPPKLQEEWLRKAIEVSESSTQERARRWLGELYADLGWRLFDLRQFESSLRAHQQSLKGFQDRNSPAESLEARWAIARVLRQLGRVPEALAQAESLLLEMGSDAFLYGRLCEETAECLLALKRGEVAQPHFARAYRELSLPTRIPDRHPLRLKRLKDLGKVD